jgi:Tol biopolymer transport system component
MRTLAAFLALVTLAAAAVGGCKGGGGEVSPTPTGVATRTATATATVVPQEGLRLVYKEFGSEADTVWLATAADPQKGTKVGVVDHATNVGISASLSPDGKRIAYLVLPTTGGDSSLDAEAWLLEMDSGKTRQLASNLDGAGEPVWSPDGSSIVVLRNGPQGQMGQAVSLLKLDVSDGSETVLMQADDVLGLYPISYSPDGSSLYFAEIILSGTHFGAVPAAGGSAQLLVQASDQVARDWHLSPDGSYVAFLAGQPTDDRIAVRAFVVELVEGAEPQPLSDLAAALDAGDHFNPVWYPDGERVTLGRTPADGASAAALVSLPGGELEEVTPGPDQGFDVPVEWSPEGDYLAVRSFEGSSAAQPGREHLVIIELGKGREMVADGGNLEFIGWLAGDSQ